MWPYVTCDRVRYRRIRRGRHDAAESGSTGSGAGGDVGAHIIDPPALTGYGPAIILMGLSVLASSRYIWWRLTQTTDLDSTLEAFLGMGLLAAECYTWIVLVLGYIQNARPLRRKPAPLPPIAAVGRP